MSLYDWRAHLVISTTTSSHDCGGIDGGMVFVAIFVTFLFGMATAMAFTDRR